MGETSIGSSSSSSKATTSYEYHVFLSFRGSDTRDTFTSHLHAGLKNAGYSVYLDEKSMEEGKEINEDITRAIENSRLCMPVFSQNYANSKACLNELYHMVKCEKEIIPIFYDVEPDVVDLKKDVYRNALDVHRRSGKVEPDKITEWEQALKKVASIKGHVLHNKKEADVITSIIENLWDIVKLKLQDMPKPFIDVDDKEVMELFNSSPKEWQIIGIYGLGGIGKTTLARVIYNELYLRFDGCSFLENVREKLEKDRHTRELQQQLFQEIIGYRIDPNIVDRNDGINKLKWALENKKILLVFDDINDDEQLEYLIGNVCFARGSRIIVTTRNKEIVERLTQKYERVLDHEVKGMKDHQALELLYKSAFHTDHPPVRHKNLGKQIISYAGNIPLALKLIGSRLSVTKEDVWEETLKELKKCPGGKMEKTMMISYEALNENQKNIFVDIANYHGDLHKRYACYMWEKWNPGGSIAVLMKWSLINVIYKYEYKGSKVEVEYLHMHDVLKDFGRNIHQPPRSLYINGNLDDLRGIELEEKASVEMLSISNGTITREDMAGFYKLRFLELRDCNVIENFEDPFPNLRWLSLFSGLEFKPINFQPKNLVVLSHSSCDIDISTMKADKLKALHLQNWKSDNIEIPFKKFSSLELVTLDGSLDWTEIAPSSTNLKNLTQLTVKIRRSKSVDPMDWIWIGNLTSLCKLELSNTSITELPNSIGHLKELKELRVTTSYLKRVPELPSGLTHLNIESMSHTMQVDWSTQFKLMNIIKLELYCQCVRPMEGNYLSFEWIKSATNLKNLRLRIPYIITGLEKVAELTLLKHLEAFHAEFQRHQLLPSSLLELTLTRCNFHNGNLDVSKLKDLKTFKLYRCEEVRNIQGFAELEFLECVRIWFCDDLQELSPADLSKLKNAENLRVSINECPKLPEIIR